MFSSRSYILPSEGKAFLQNFPLEYKLVSDSLHNLQGTAPFFVASSKYWKSGEKPKPINRSLFDRQLRPLFNLLAEPKSKGGLNKVIRVTTLRAPYLLKK